MRRYAVTAAMVLVIGGAAQAQVFVRPAPFGFSPYTARFNYGYAFFPSATGGYGFTFARGFRSQSNFLVTSVGPYVTPGVLGGTYYRGSSMAGGVDAVGVRQQNLLWQAQGQANINPAIRQAKFDQIGATVNRDEIVARLKTAPEAVRLSATEATDTTILSGAALGDLLDGLKLARPIAGVGGKDAISPELLADLRFTGGTAAETLSLFRAETLDYPAALTVEELNSLRTATDRTFTQIRANLMAGRRANPETLDQLANHAKRLRAKYAATGERIASQAEVKAVTDFLNRLSVACGQLKKAESDGLIIPDWFTAGTTAADLTAYMHKYEMRFAAAGPGAEPAYLAVHRALTVYLSDSWVK